MEELYSLREISKMSKRSAWFSCNSSKTNVSGQDTKKKTTFRGKESYLFNNNLGFHGRSPTKKHLLDILKDQATTEAPSLIPRTPEPSRRRKHQISSRENADSPLLPELESSTTPTKPQRDRPPAFEWTPKDLRMIFSSNTRGKQLTFKTPNTGKPTPPEKKLKKKPTKSCREGKEKLRQLKIFELEKV